MGGANLELFRFSLYLFFPLAIMIHYGDPKWYHDNVLPFRENFWPKEENLFKPPRNYKDLQLALHEERIKKFGKEKAEEISKKIAIERGYFKDLINLKLNNSIGSISSYKKTGLRTNDSLATWREHWSESQKGKVV